MESRELKLVLFRDPSGNVPFTAWFSALKDKRAKNIVVARLARLRTGNLGKNRSLGLGVHELKIHYANGYRIYYAYDGLELVILLCAGDKSSQNEDIKKAKSYWQIYKKEKKDERS